MYVSVLCSCFFNRIEMSGGNGFIRRFHSLIASQPAISDMATTINGYYKCIRKKKIIMEAHMTLGLRVDRVGPTKNNNYWSAEAGP